VVERRTAVLVIEDDPDLGLLLVDILDMHRDVVATLVTHPSAVPADATPDIVVTDLVGSAWYDRATATRQLEGLRRRFPGVPIILVTAHWQAEADRTELPADAVMTKPFDVDDLAQLVLSFDVTRRSSEHRGAREA
jgi:DNA-binding response OmpR family regulator